MSKLAYIIAAIYGLTAVILGAMAAHALEKSLSADLLDSFETAVRFQMYHALLLFLLGIVMEKYESAQLKYATYASILGTLLFSGSIYLLVLTPIKLGIVTPIGGSILIVGWGLILFWAIKLKRND
ncbi:MAG: DUF423 domain-containing protein [Bacteroidia bacterium]|nr:DUF423 domain-containing protein [Bacteroidia bacterium]